MQKKLTIVSIFYILILLNTKILPARPADDGSAVSTASYSTRATAGSFSQPPVVGAFNPADGPHSPLQHHQDPYNRVDPRHWPSSAYPHHSHHQHAQHLAQQQHLALQHQQPLAQQYPQPFVNPHHSHQTGSPLCRFYFNPPVPDLKLAALLTLTDQAQQEEQEKRDELAKNDVKLQRLKHKKQGETQRIMQGHQEMLMEMQMEIQGLTHSLTLARHEAQELKKALDLKEQENKRLKEELKKK
jgi:hypothetical protein